MKLRKIKKYIFYLTALMPFITFFFYLVYIIYANETLGMTDISIQDAVNNTFRWFAESILPSFLEDGFYEALNNIFAIQNEWGNALLSYFNYFVTICIYNLMIEVFLFFIYLFESWVNKIEKDF